VKEDHVFLNVPFDRRYEPLFVTLIGALVGLGFQPRSVLEINSTSDRLQRLWSLISECRFSIHDLSRVERASRGFRVPRFNMPFEAGLAVAFGLSDKHQWLLFEARSYRIQQSLSDLNGFDPIIHGGTKRGMIRAVLNAFDTRPADEARTRLLVNGLARYRKVSKDPTVFDRRAYANLVRAAVGLRQTIYGP
jgi:hypothetical protein